MTLRPRVNPRLSKLAAIALPVIAAASLPLLAGCGKSDAEAGIAPPPEAEVVLVHTGPLVSEHPLYDEYQRLALLLRQAPASQRMAALEEFMASPIGRRLRRPAVPAFHGPEFRTVWEQRAAVALESHYGAASGLLIDWPRPEDDRAEEQIRGEKADAIRALRNEASIARMRAETEAVRRRAGELSELRLLAESEDPEEAAIAADLQARVWREIEAAVAEVARESEERLAAVEAEYEERLSEARKAHALVDEAAPGRHADAVRDAGEAGRRAQADGVGSAMEPVALGDGLTDTPPPPAPGDLSDLIAQTAAAQQAAQAGRRARLIDAQARLLTQIGEGTERAVRAVAARNGIELLSPAEADADTPDATERFRSLLRDYWAARRPVQDAE